MALREGDLEWLCERGYSLGQEIGRGSYAAVHMADYRRPRTDQYQVLACRVFDKQGAPRDFVQTFFDQELEILKRIRNPHLVQVHSIHALGPRVYIFMRYEENGDLLGLLMSHGPVTEGRARRWLRQMSCGLDYLHGHHIAHRDLKCENLLVSRSGNVKIADFGFATVCVLPDGSPLLSAVFCGSAAYAAPEVLSGTPHHPPPTDLWSLGIVLFVMLSFSMPFDDSLPPPDLVKEQLTRTWRRRLSEAGVSVSGAAWTLLDQLLEPDTVRRLTVAQVLEHGWLQKTQSSLQRRSESPALRSAVPTTSPLVGHLS